MILPNILAQQAQRLPDKVCMKFGDQRITYAEMAGRVSSTAGGIIGLGLKPGDRAAILMDNCPEYIISYFAIISAGGIAVPINTFLTPAEVTFILKDCGCRVMIFSRKFAGHAEEIRKGLPDVIQTYYESIPQKSCDSHPAQEDDIAVLLYTSGTTGFPKGAMLTHRNLISNAEACRQVMQFSEKDRVLLFLPLFHSFSFTVCVILPLYTGAQIVLLSSVRPFSLVIKSIVRDRITFFVAVPTVFNILSKKRVPFVLKLFLKLLISIRACVSGAAALPEDTLHAIEGRFGVPLIEGYGLTEASPVVAVNPLKGVRKPSSVGLPLPGIEVATVGDDGNVLTEGGTGELIVRGPNVMKGYWERAEETSAVLKEGWLYTGDMARIDGDGYIYIVDRKKDLVIVDGMNVYPREIEDHVIRHPSVEECAMVGVPDGKGSEITVLFVRKKENATLDEKEVRSHMKGHLANYKIPRRIIFIEDFPRTATGKIKKTELRRVKLS